MRSHVPQRLDGVVEASRKGILGRETVVNGEESCLRVVGKPTAQPVVSLEIPHHKIAAVKVDDQGLAIIDLGNVQPSREYAVLKWNRCVARLHVERNISPKAQGLISERLATLAR